MADTVYNKFKHRSATGDSDIGVTDYRMLLLETTAAGAFDPDLDHVQGLLAVGGVAEFTGTNYARASLDGEAATEDDANNRATADFTDEVFTSLGVPGGTDGSVVAAVVYEEGGGTEATRWLVSYHDTNFPVVTNGQNFTVATPNNWLYLT